MQIAIEVGLTIGRTVWVLFGLDVYVQQSSELWECGNRAAISKDGGKDGKPAFGFPGFPSVVISTALPRSLTNGCLSVIRSFAVPHERKQLRLLVDDAIGNAAPLLRW
jgi:hypothetical protein